jgi:hypothetical protein
MFLKQYLLAELQVFIPVILFSQTKVYKANSNYSNDVIYNVKDGKVYKGNSSYSNDVLFTIKDGKVYKGSSNYSNDILATIKNGKVDKGNSLYSNDVEFTIDRQVTVAEFVAIWYSVKYNF